MSTLNVLGKIIYIILALPKGNVQHEFTLWRILKPVRWKLEVFNLSCVQ
ncbi:MAG: hypothetical protein Q7K44_00105 [Candidatus Liptonbacteria bacterium]|nr:hypothetical protein [Candidatus Liptonbacteria bacterium]